MSIFEKLNDKFFNPFCCKNRELYLECVTQLIEKSKEIPVLYETDARSCLTLYLQNISYAIEREDIGEEISGSRSPLDNASAILRYFRGCGWIMPQEIGRSGDNIASVSVYCRKLIDAVNRIFNFESNGTITNHIFSIYDILKGSLEKDSARASRPYSNILVPLTEQESALKNELLILKDSIREIMRNVIKMTNMNSMGQFLIKNELLNSFFNDYFFIKRSGTIPSYILQIDRMLRKLRSSAVYDKMIREYVQIKKSDEFSARDVIDRQFEQLDSFINFEYEQQMSYIDKKINVYYNLYSVRFMMIMSNGVNLEQELGKVLLYLKDLDNDERNAVIKDLAQAYRQMNFGYIGRKSFARRKKRNRNVKNIGIAVPELSDSERQRMTDEILTEYTDKYSLDNVRERIDMLASGKEQLSVEECSIRTRNDAMMVAASIIYSGAEGFPYEVEIHNDTVQTEAAEISRINIKRRTNE